MDSKQKVQATIRSIEERLINGQIQRGYDELLHYLKHSSPTIELLILRVKLEDKLQKYENALKTWYKKAVM
jgi:hypothetical protein